LLLVSLALSAGLAAIGKLFGTWLPEQEIVLQVLELLFSFAVITGLFAMMFKLLPDAKIAWSDVWVGAGMTALLFTVGKFVIGLYLGKSDVGSTYGAAGSLVIILVWVYYSSQILLFGAEFTQVHAKRFGSRIVPTENAVAVDQENDRKPTGIRKSATAPSETIAAEAFQDAPGRRVASRYPDRTFSRQDRWIGLFLLLMYGVELLRRKRPQNEAHGLPRWKGENDGEI
jgi:hypothetical protein